MVEPGVKQLRQGRTESKSNTACPALEPDTLIESKLNHFNRRRGSKAYRAREDGSGKRVTQSDYSRKHRERQSMGLYP